MNIIVDNREKDIINLFKNTSCEYNCKNLNIGDIQFISNDNIIYIIERKTVNDLGTSIKDGRYKEQKERLLSNSKGEVYYIIEGNIDDCTTFSKKALLGSIINMLFRDNIKIIYSKNIEQTLDIIIQIKNKYDSGKFKQVEHNNETYLSSIKINKKDNMDKTLCQALQLATIPGVSKNTSVKILEQYGSLYKLLEEYNKVGEYLLSDLILGKRKLGKILSKKIYDYLI